MQEKHSESGSLRKISPATFTTIVLNLGNLSWKFACSLSWGGSPVTSADDGSENLSLSQGGKEQLANQDFLGFLHITT